MNDQEYEVFLTVDATTMNREALIKLGQQYPQAMIRVTPEENIYEIELLRPVYCQGHIISGPGKL